MSEKRDAVEPPATFTEIAKAVVDAGTASPNELAEALITACAYLDIASVERDLALETLATARNRIRAGAKKRAADDITGFLATAQDRFVAGKARLAADLLGVLKK